MHKLKFQGIVNVVTKQKFNKQKKNIIELTKMKKKNEKNIINYTKFKQKLKLLSFSFFFI